MAFRVCILLWLSTLCLKAQKLDFEQRLKEIESLTYNLPKFDSAYALADEMLIKAENDYENGLANLAKGLVISKNGWGYYLGEYAVPYLQESINYLAKTNQREYLNDALIALSLCYITKYNPNNNLTSAKEMQYLTKALRVKNEPNYQVEIPFEASLDDRNANSQDLKIALTQVQKDLDLAIKSGDKVGEMYRTEKLAYIYWQLDSSLFRSEELLLKAAQLATENGNEFFKSICLSQLTVYSNKTMDYRKALSYGLEGLTHTQRHGFSIREPIFRDQLYLSYRELGQMNKAIEQKMLSIEKAEALQAESQPRRIKMVKDRIKALEYQNELELELRNKNQRIKLISLGFGALLLLFGMIIFSNLRLRQKNKEIKTASLLGQSLERKRMAADLHDTLGSNLSSVIWTLDAIDLDKFQTTEREILSTTKVLVKDSYDYVRLLSHNLLPEILKEKGLLGSLHELIRQINKHAKTQFLLEENVTTSSIDSKVEFEIYSICLELYTNILNHSKAAKSWTNITIHNNVLTLEISDNGLGYDFKSQEGFGLRNIKERIESINGKWRVTSMPDGGTKNEIEVNLKGKKS